MKIWSGIVSANILWGVQNGDTWTGSIPYSDRNIILSGGSHIAVTLDKISGQNQSQASKFGRNGGN